MGNSGGRVGFVCKMSGENRDGQLCDWGEHSSSLWVVIPTYNEAENISVVIGEILTILPEANVLVVDDASADGTTEIVSHLGDLDARIHILYRSSKLGYASAVSEGFAAAAIGGSQVIVQMDADMSHDPAVIPQMLNTLKRADVVIGSRYVPGGGTRNWSIVRQVISRCANYTTRFLLGVSTRDCTSGFRCWRSETWERAGLEALRMEGYGFLALGTLLVERARLRIVEVPIIFSERRFGRSKFSRKVILEAAGAVLRLFLSRCGFVGLSCSVIGPRKG